MLSKQKIKFIRSLEQKKFRKKLKEVRQMLKKMRSLKPRVIIAALNKMLIGYDQYYGITDNIHSLSAFHHEVRLPLF